MTDYFIEVNNKEIPICLALADHVQELMEYPTSFSDSDSSSSDSDGEVTVLASSFLPEEDARQKYNLDVINEYSDFWRHFRG